MSLLAGVMDVLGLTYEVSETNLTNHISQFQLVYYDTSQQWHWWILPDAVKYSQVFLVMGKNITLNM
jgi:hypothetical protein